MKIDSKAFAESSTEKNPLRAFQPSIQKELVQLEVFQSLSRYGLLDCLILRGGASLRFFHGSERCAENLRFTMDASFDGLDIERFSSVLRRDLWKAFGREIEVMEPTLLQDLGNAETRAWKVAINATSQSKDFSSQRIEVEITSAPSCSSEIRQIIPSYQGLPSHCSRILLKCQKLEEVLADKLIYFASTEGHVRYWDLWDIPWLTMQREVENADIPERFERKWGDYGCSRSLAALIAIGRKRAMTEIESDAFAGQMRRLLPSDVYEHTVSSFDYRNLMLGRIVKAYDSLTCALNLEAQVRQEWLSLSDVAQAPKHESRMVRGKTI